MKFLGITNFKIICKSLQDINDNDYILKKQDQILIYHIMKDIYKEYIGLPIKELNKKVISFIVPLITKNKNNVEINNPLKNLKLNENLKKSFTIPLIEQRLTNDFLISNTENLFMDTFKELNKQYTDFINNKKVYKREDERQLLPDKYNKILNKIYQDYEQVHYLLIDSRDINYDKYSSSDYKYKLPFLLKDVKSIELINANIPNTEYPINESNNKLHFQELNSQVSSDTYYTVSLTPGYYTINELISELQLQLTNIGSSNYSVTLLNNKIRILSDLTGGDGIFNLLLKGDNEMFKTTTRTTYINNSLGKVLGYDNLNYTGNSFYLAQNSYKIDSEDYVFLNIKNINNKIFSSNNYSEDNLFGKLSLKNINPGEILHYVKNNKNIIQYFKPPIENLEHLDISFTKYNGTNYNFNGHEHSLLLKICCFSFDKTIESHEELLKP